MSEMEAILRGHLSDVEHQRDYLREENVQLRAALRRIADSESGVWGWIAHEALHPKSDATVRKDGSA